MGEIKILNLCNPQKKKKHLQTNNNSVVSIFLLHPSLPSCRCRIATAVVEPPPSPTTPLWKWKGFGLQYDTALFIFLQK
jgi:hypothetical protein